MFRGPVEISVCRSELKTKIHNRFAAAPLYANDNEKQSNIQNNTQLLYSRASAVSSSLRLLTHIVKFLAGSPTNLRLSREEKNWKF